MEPSTLHELHEAGEPPEGDAPSSLRRLRRAQTLALAQTLGLGLVVLWPLVAVACGFPMSPVSIVLAPIAYHLAQGRRKLRALDSSAPSHLVLDQLVILGLVLVYCCWKVYLAWPDRELSPLLYGPENTGLAALSRHDGGTFRRVVVSLFYGGIFAASCTVQILLARFYHSLHADLQRAQGPQQEQPTDEDSPSS